MKLGAHPYLTITLALTLACLFTPIATIAQDAPPCFGLVKPYLNSGGFLRLQTAILSPQHSEKEAETWLRRMTSNSYFPQLLWALRSVSEEERNILLLEIKKFPKESNFRRLVELGLYDPATWRRDFPALAIHATPAGINYGLFKTWLEELPADLKAELLETVRTTYRSAPKEADLNGGSFWARLGPKRGMDSFINHVTRPDQVFLSAIESGAKPFDAYKKAFLQNQKFSGTTEGRAPFQPEEVLKLCREAQKEMNNPDLPITKNDFLLLVGSFVNGKASVHSDIDIALVSYELQEIKDSTRLGFVFPGSGQAEKRITDSLITPDRPQELKLHPFPRGVLAVENIGQLNPFQIKVSREKIELWVWPLAEPKAGIPEAKIYLLE